MPKTLTTSNTTSNGHVTYSPGVNPHAVQIMPGMVSGGGGGVMSQQGSSECTSPFLNQSKITDSSTLQLTGQSNGADPNYYQELYNSSPSTLPIYHQIQGQPGQQQQQQVPPQMCCYNTTAQQSRPRNNQQRLPGSPTDLHKMELSGNSADSGLDLTGNPVAIPGLAVKFAEIEVAKELVTFHEILQEGTFGRLCRGVVAIP